MTTAADPPEAVSPKLPEELRATLRLVGSVMQAASEPWWIIGSAAVALHGAGSIAVADVDVVLSECDAARISARLGLVQARKSPHPRFRSSALVTWNETPLPVEFMAGFHLHDGDGWAPLKPITRLAIVIDSTVLYAPERQEMQEILTRFGRPKDLERRRLLVATRA
ncbi:hypothetical protein [Bosea sp. TND4EK4]|uniref:hypothetical protein n=1 Tax=Bosea sp. TND4EK4 TaxID=1907408 RepID=UPI000954F90A|nr:hypothetical protein [Bosea sp. TND4EK4]SIQ10998.1 hypothetical protein SAMN05880592_101953 [Bosea sp. TND4EK4]